MNILKNPKNRTFAVLCVLLVLFAVIACQEKVNEPCGEDVTVCFTVLDCETDCDLPAEGAFVRLVKIKDGIEIPTDSFVTEEDGEVCFLLDSLSCCGAEPAEYKIEVEHNGCSVEKYLHEVGENTQLQDICACCPSDEVTCDNLSGGTDLWAHETVQETSDCISNGTTQNDISYTNNSNGSDIHIRYTGTNRCRVNLAALTGFISGTGKWKFSRVAINGTNLTAIPATEILNYNDKLSVFFLFTPDEVGAFNETLSLPLECIDDDENELNTGAWTITLNACVEEVTCDCPWDIDVNGIDTWDMTPNEPVIDGQNISSSDILVAEINFGDLAEGCSYRVDDIVRLTFDEATNSMIPNATSLSIAAATGCYNFSIDAINPSLPMTLGNYMVIGSELTVNATFHAGGCGNTRDTFRISGVILKDDDPNYAEPCMKDFILEGESCRNSCPEVELIQRVTGDNIYYSQPTNPNLNVEIGDRFEMGKYESNNIFYVQDSCGLASPCFLGSKFTHVFEINYTEEQINCMCEDDLADFNLLISDNDGFSYEASAKMWDIDLIPINQETWHLRVAFTPPSKHKLDSLRDNNLVSTDNEINVRISVFSELSADGCHQIFDFKRNLNEKHFETSPRRTMDAYNQISPNHAAPDYFACKIDERDIVLDWAPGPNDILPVAADFYPNTNFTFFFNVEEPLNANLIQRPKLYMVPTAGNTFNRILNVPVEFFANKDDLEANAKTLVAKLFQETGFTTTTGIFAPTITSNTVEWNQTNGAGVAISNMVFEDPLAGLDIKKGDVFLVWNDKILTDEEEVFDYTCQVALIYIAFVSDGDPSKDEDNDGIAQAGYRVVYPIEVYF